MQLMLRLRIKDAEKPADRITLASLEPSKIG
jgi:hypothetical protein